MEFLLPHVRHGLADDLPNILRHNCPLLGGLAQEQSQPVDLGGCDVDVIGRLPHHECLFLFGDGRMVVEVLLNVLKGDIGLHFGLQDLLLLHLGPFFEVKDLLLGDVVFIGFDVAFLFSLEAEVSLPLPVVLVVDPLDFPLPAVPVEVVELDCLEHVREVVGLVEHAVGHAETHIVRQVLKGPYVRGDLPDLSNDVLYFPNAPTPLVDGKVPVVVFFFELDLVVAVLLPFEDPPGLFAFAEDAGASLLEDHLALLEDLEAVVGEVLAEHLALGVDVGLVLFLEVGQGLVGHQLVVLVEGVEGVVVVPVEQQGLRAFLLVDAVGEGLVVGVHPQVLFVLLLDLPFAGVPLLLWVAGGRPVVFVFLLLEVVVAGPEVEVAFEALDFVGEVDVFLAFGADDAADDLDPDAVEGLVVQVKLFPEVGGDHVLVEVGAVPQQVAAAVGHPRAQVLQVVLYLVAAPEARGVVPVVEPLRPQLEKLLAQLQLLHLPGLHEGHAPLVGVRVLVAQLPRYLRHVVLLELAPDDLAVPDSLDYQGKVPQKVLEVVLSLQKGGVVVVHHFRYLLGSHSDPVLFVEEDEDRQVLVHVPQPDCLPLDLPRQLLPQQLNVPGKEAAAVTHAAQLGPDFLSAIRPSPEKDPHLFKPPLFLAVQVVDVAALGTALVVVVAVLPAYAAPVGAGVALHAFRAVLVVLRVLSPLHLGASQHSGDLSLQLFLLLVA